MVSQLKTNVEVDKVNVLEPAFKNNAGLILRLCLMHCNYNVINASVMHVRKGLQIANDILLNMLGQ